MSHEDRYVPNDMIDDRTPEERAAQERATSSVVSRFATSPEEEQKFRSMLGLTCNS
jgi:hypothetical protein